MWELAKTLIVSRGGQLAARLASQGILFLAGLLSVNLESGSVEVTAQVIGTLALAAVLALFDLIVHKILNPKSPEAPSARPLALLAVLLLLPALSGCWGTKPPPSVDAARTEKNKAIHAYVEGNEQVIDAILDAYRQEAWARIDLGMQKDIETAKANAQATGGKVDINQALAFASKLMQERDDAKLKTEQIIGRMRDIMAANRVNLAISMKLDDAISAYESAGFDMSAAKNAADEIMALVAKTTKGRAP